MADKRKTKTQGSSSINKLKTILPALNPAGSHQTLLTTKHKVESIQKLYFRKAIHKKVPIPQNEKNPIAVSAKNIRHSMAERENGWNSRFVLDHIPTLYPKQKNSTPIKGKLSLSRLKPHIIEAIGRSVKTRQSMNSMKTLNGARRYQSVTRQDTSRQVGQTTGEETIISPTKDAASTVKQGLPGQTVKVLLQRRDKIYRMENIYLQKQMPLFHKNIIKKIFSHIKLNEATYFSQLNFREFKEFFDAVDSAVLMTSEREQSLKFLSSSIKEILQKGDKQTNIKEEIEPLLYEVSMLTLSSIQSIVRWRQKLLELVEKFNITSINPSVLDYQEQQGKRYISKILQDTRFLLESKLYPNAVFPDPFLLSYELGKIYQDRDLMYKVRASELFILEQNINCC